MSEKTLDKLISSLKTEAIEAAEKEAASIEEEARQKAAKLQADSRAECEEMHAEAEAKARQTLEKGLSALRQAARDVTINLRNEILKLYGNVLDHEVNSQFTPDVVQRAIVVVLDNIGNGVELQLSDDLRKELSDHIHQKLKDSDLILKNSGEGTIKKSITITKEDEGWSYHITPEAVSELLKRQLGESWVEIINKS